jgi:hypothetical protein
LFKPIKIDIHQSTCPFDFTSFFRQLYKETISNLKINLVD